MATAAAVPLVGAGWAVEAVVAVVKVAAAEGEKETVAQSGVAAAEEVRLAVWRVAAEVGDIAVEEV